jgi:hypothetical protein
MQTVGLGITDIIEAIDTTGGKAKGYENQYTGPHIAPVGSMTAEEQRRENKRVLQPLMRANQPDNLSIHVSSVLDRVLMTDDRIDLWL